MPDPEEIADETRRLRAVTQQTRLRVIESKLSVARTLCTAAESYINIGDLTQAANLLQQAESMEASGELSMASSPDLPMAVLRTQLAKLQEHIRELKLRLESQDTRPGSDGD